MENEIQKSEVKKAKGLWDILKGTLAGIDNEGSAKRITSFYIVMFLLTALHAVYLIAFMVIVNRAASNISPSSIDTTVIKMYDYVFAMDHFTIWLLLGLATVETITGLVKTIKGQNTNDKPA
jgi:hypothetical protein